MKRFFNVFGHILVLLVFLGAAWLLYDELKKYTFRQFVDAIQAIPPWCVVGAMLLTAVNYVILVGYDWFAVRWVGVKDLPVRKIALASFTGYAFSYNFGATLFGTSIRYRLYAGWGVPLLKIIELLIILGLTFWFGVFTLAGVVFIAAPFKVPSHLKIPGRLEPLALPFTDTYWAGVVLLAIAVGYVVLNPALRKLFARWRWQIPLPPLKLTLYQIVIACGDLMVAAAVLYVLLPPVEGGYLRVLGIYTLAFVVGVLTHVPGGYGVFDVLIVALMPPEAKLSVLAAVLAYRVVYNWVPLAIAAVLLLRNEFKSTDDVSEEPLVVEHSASTSPPPVERP